RDWSSDVCSSDLLVRKICDKCRTEVKPNDSMKEFIKKELARVPKSELEGIDIENPAVWEAPGCAACGNSGYRGRVGIYEVVDISKSIQDLITDRKPAIKIEEYAVEHEGMLLMKQDGLI